MKPQLLGIRTSRRGRTPPGVRELKLVEDASQSGGKGRTPPGVRELKRQMRSIFERVGQVAPLPGCVN